MGSEMCIRDSFWKELKATEQQRITELLVKGISVDLDAVKIDLRLEGFSTIIKKLNGGKNEHACI